MPKPKKLPQSLSECLLRLNAHYEGRLSAGFIEDFTTDFAAYPLDWVIRACNEHIKDTHIVNGQPAGIWPPKTANLMAFIEEYNRQEKAERDRIEGERDARKEVARKEALEQVIDPDEQDEDKWLTLELPVRQITKQYGTGAVKETRQVIRVPRRPTSRVDCPRCMDKGRVMFWYDPKQAWRVFTLDAAQNLPDSLFQPLKTHEALCSCPKGMDLRNRYSGCLWGAEGIPPTAITIERVEKLEEKRRERERVAA